MSWAKDNLAPVETLLFRSRLVKVGRFACPAGHASFPVTEPIDNDVFVLPRLSLWFRRGTGAWRFIESGAILMHRAGGMIERRSANATGDFAYWFAIRPEIFADALQRYALSARDIGEALLVDPKIRYRLAVLVNAICRSQTSRLAAEEEVLSLFFEICEQCSDRTRERPRTAAPDPAGQAAFCEGANVDFAGAAIDRK